MIVEQRTYTFPVGNIPKFLKLYEESGARAVQMRILGNMVGYFVTELGMLNQTVHMWGYSSLDDRMARRGQLMQDPVWQVFMPQAAELITTQETKILLPTAFSPIGGTSD